MLANKLKNILYQYRDKPVLFISEKGRLFNCLNASSVGEYSIDIEINGTKSEVGTGKGSHILTTLNSLSHAGFVDGDYVQSTVFGLIDGVRYRIKGVMPAYGGMMLLIRI